MSTLDEQAEAARNNAEAARITEQNANSVVKPAEDSARNARDTATSTRQQAETRRRLATAANERRRQDEVARRRAQATHAKNPRPRTQAALDKASENAQVSRANAASLNGEALNLENTATLQETGALRAEAKAAGLRGLAELATQQAQNLEIGAKQAELLAIEARVASLEKKVKGVKFDTALDFLCYVTKNWVTNILGKMEIKYVADERNVVVGFHHTLYLNRKTEWVAGIKNSIIAGWEGKKVIGLALTKVTGYKKDVVNGAKSDFLLGPKFEYHKGHKVEIGNGKQTIVEPVVKKKGEELRAHTKMLKYNISVDEIKGKTSEIKATEYLEKIGSVESDFGNWEAEYDEFFEKVGEYEANFNYFSATATDEIIWNAGGDMKIVSGGSSLELTSAHAQLKKANQSVECTNGGITIRGTQAEWK